MSKADEEFINRIIALIEEHMTNEQLNVEWLSSAAHKPFEPAAQGQEHHQPLGGGLHPPDTSEKSGPHAAGRETQDQRSVLRRRHHLPSYFSRLFYKQFGMRPRDFEKMHKPEEPQTDGGDAPKHA